MAEDLGEEDIVGDVLGFELVATVGAIGGAEVAGFQGRSREPKAAETYFGSSRAGGGVNGLGGREAFEIPESVEGLDNFLGVGQNGDGIWLETGTGGLAKFSSWPSKRRAG